MANTLYCTRDASEAGELFNCQVQCQVVSGRVQVVAGQGCVVLMDGFTPEAASELRHPCIILGMRRAKSACKVYFPRERLPLATCGRPTLERSYPLLQLARLLRLPHHCFVANHWIPVARFLASFAGVHIVCSISHGNVTTFLWRYLQYIVEQVRVLEAGFPSEPHATDNEY